MIDVHCHVDLYPKPAEVISEIARRGTYVLAVTTTPSAFEGNLKFVGDAKRIQVAAGLHPELVAQRAHEVDALCALLPRVKYVGEVGLDGSPDHRTFLPVQKEVLRRVFERAKELGGRVISLHSRMAATAVLDEIEAQRGLGLPVLHWFSGSQKELERAISLGCWFSVSPTMLASWRSRALLDRMPHDRLLIESDGPFGLLDGRAAKPWEAERAMPLIAKAWNMDDAVTTSRIKMNFQKLTAAANAMFSQP